MKKILPAFIFTLLVLKSSADWDMMFCDSVDDKNNCTGKSSAFTLSGSEIKFTVMLQNAGGIRTDKVYFEVYTLDPNTYAEDLKTIEEVKTQSTQAMVYHTLSITQKGHYLIKARDAFKDYITSREIEIK